MKRMSTIIKAAGAELQNSGQPIQHVAFDFGDMAEQANRYIQRVREQAAKIIETAETEAEAIRQRAEEEGRQAALATAKRVLEQRVAERIKTLGPALEQSIQSLDAAQQDWFNHWQQQAVHLATAIAERVIRRELACQPEIPMQLIREALELAAGSAEITLHLHPGDHRELGEQAQRLAAAIAPLGTVQIVADAAIHPGGCRVSTQFGSIDQQIEAQLQRIEQELA